MHNSGILILTSHISRLCSVDVIKQILNNASRIVETNLYVHLENSLPKKSDSYFSDNHQKVFEGLEKKCSPCFNQLPTSSDKWNCSADVLTFISRFYSQAFYQCKHLNISILTHNLGHPKVLKKHHYLRCSVDCILADLPTDLLNEAQNQSTLQNFVTTAYDWKSQPPGKLPAVFSVGDLFCGTHVTSDGKCIASLAEKRWNSCVLGGTFDHIHPGHKVMLSEASILTRRRLLLGVTDGDMLNHKLFSEIIKPWQNRFDQLKNFMLDIGNFQYDDVNDSALEDLPALEIVKITDAFGPSVTDPDLDCIIVSQETTRGGEKVNEVRVANGLGELHVHVISEGNLVQDDSCPDTNESKVSSSTLRYETLGTLLKPPQQPGPLSSYGYVIGLTGSIASGKSSIARRLEKLGANVVDCDKLGHLAYEPGTDTFTKVVERFGTDIVGSDGTIDRARLAGKVFTGDNKSENLSALNSIVWPAIEDLVKQTVIGNSKNSSNQVHVLEAAVLIEAGWQTMTDEVWLVTVPEKESIKRVMERDGRSEEEATKRLKSQMSSKDKAQHANVVLSTLWEPAVTQKQVEKAWSELCKRLPQ